MRKGTTKSGFSYEFDETRLDDMYFVDVMASVLDQNAKEFDLIVSTSKFMEMLLGKEMKEKLYKHIASQNNGRVPIAVYKQYLAEILTGSEKTETEIKN